MKTLFRIAVLSLLIGSVGCAEADPSILFNAHVFYEASDVMLADCTPVTFEDNHTVSGDFTVNLSDSASHRLGMVMTNRLDASDQRTFGPDDNQLRSDVNLITLNAIEFTMADGGPLSNLGDGGVVRYNIGTLLRTGADIHAAIPLVTLENRQEWEALAPTGGSIVSTFMDVQIFGTTVGGDPVESNLLTMPLQLCADCQVPSTPICAVVN